MKLFKNLRAKTLNIGKQLFAFDQLSRGFKDQSKIIKSTLKYETQTIEPQEENLYVPTQQVLEARKSFRVLVLLFLGLFALGIVYAIVNFIVSNWVTGILSLAFSMLCLSFAYRYHFWLYQIKKQTLGLTFDDYYRDVIEPWLAGGKKKQAIKKDKK